MNDYLLLVLALVFLAPIYAYPFAYAVGEYFAERPRQWQAAMIVLDAVCVAAIAWAVAR